MTTQVSTPSGTWTITETDGRYEVVAPSGEIRCLFASGMQASLHVAMLLDEMDRVRSVNAELLSAPTWLVWSNEHAAWWGPNHSQYYWSIEAAGRYTLEEALEICQSRGVKRGDGINPPELIQPSPEWLAARCAALAKGGA